MYPRKAREVCAGANATLHSARNDISNARIVIFVREMFRNCFGVRGFHYMNHFSTMFSSSVVCSLQPLGHQQRFDSHLFHMNFEYFICIYHPQLLFYPFTSMSLCRT